MINWDDVKPYVAVVADVCFIHIGDGMWHQRNFSLLLPRTKTEWDIGFFAKQRWIYMHWHSDQIYEIDWRS